MDIRGIKVDPQKIEQGDWVGEKYGTPIPEMGDLCLKVRGANNSDWRKLQSKLTAAVPRNKRIGGRLDGDEADAITTKLLLQTGLIGWENVKDGEAQIPYTLETAEQMIGDPTLRAFRDVVLWACTTVGEGVAEQAKADAKN
jgi:hypothetical protein